MAVSDTQIASLRAFLSNDPHEGMRLAGSLVDSDDADGFGELLYAAFVTAVRRRFSAAWTIPAVVTFVAAARAALFQDGTDIDPHAAEILIRRALGDSVITGVEEMASARAQVLVLRRLIADERLDDCGLDRFLAEARALADQLIN